MTTRSSALFTILCFVLVAAMGCGANSYEPGGDADTHEADGGNTDGDANNNPDGDDGGVDTDNPCPNGQVLWNDDYCVPTTCPPNTVRNTDGYCVPEFGNPCPSGQILWGDHCVPMTCPPNTVRDTDGYCIPESTYCPDGQILWGDHCVPTTCPPGTVRNTEGYCVPYEEECPDGMLSTPSGCECPDGQILWDDSYCVPEECPEGSVRQSDGSCVPPCGDNGVQLCDGSCVPEGGLKFQFLIGSSAILYWHTNNGDDDQNVSGYFEKTVMPSELPLVMGLYVFPGGDPTVQINIVLPMDYLSLPESEQQWYMGEWCTTWDGSVNPADYEPTDYAYCGEGSGWDIYLPRIWAHFPIHD